MSCNYSPNFQAVNSMGEYHLYTQLEHNLKTFLDWGFVNIGGFVNITRPTANINNSANFHKLSSRQDPAYPKNRVWETFKKQWVYESGVSYNTTNPIPISGVYINNAFVPGPTGNVQYPFTLNYDLGRVIFASGLPSNTSVEMDFSFRTVQTYKANDALSQWKQLQELTYKTGSVDAIVTSNHRAQMPCIIIEPTSNAIFKPYELGTKKQIVNQNILLHIFSENYVEKNNIVDIIRFQKDKELRLYDVKQVVSDKVYPLNPNGSKNIYGQNYNQLLDDSSAYLWRTSYIDDVSVMDMESLNNNIYYSTVRLDVQIFM
jgi:hypothetical protein